MGCVMLPRDLLADGCCCRPPLQALAWLRSCGGSSAPLARGPPLRQCRCHRATCSAANGSSCRLGRPSLQPRCRPPHRSLRTCSFGGSAAWSGLAAAPTRPGSTGRRRLVERGRQASLASPAQTCCHLGLSRQLPPPPCPAAPLSLSPVLGRRPPLLPPRPCWPRHPLTGVVCAAASVLHGCLWCRSAQRKPEVSLPRRTAVPAQRRWTAVGRSSGRDTLPPHHRPQAVFPRQARAGPAVGGGAPRRAGPTDVCMLRSDHRPCCPRRPSPAA